jgi:hypothetical protein
MRNQSSLEPSLIWQNIPDAVSCGLGQKPYLDIGGRDMETMYSDGTRVQISIRNSRILVNTERTYCLGLSTPLYGQQGPRFEFTASASITFRTHRHTGTKLLTLEPGLICSDGMRV